MFMVVHVWAFTSGRNQLIRYDSLVYDLTNLMTASYTRGHRNYELTNHLGNVLVSISDKKIGVPIAGSNTISHFTSDVVMAQDYYPFGMMMPGREYQAQPSRFGFNGKENDHDVKGFGNQQDYGMRIYDPRLGKFLSVDPLYKDFPMLTPFQFGSNNPIENIDVDGLEGVSNKSQLLKLAPALPTIAPGVGSGPVTMTPNGPIYGAPRFDRFGTYIPKGGDLVYKIFPRLQARQLNERYDNIPSKGLGIRNMGSLSDGNEPPMFSFFTKKEARQAFLNSALDNVISQKGAEYAKNVDEFVENNNKDFEHFYRAMSINEFIKTGGNIQQREGKNSIPFITSNPEYLLNRNSFIWQQPEKYDIIVKYTLPTGTYNYLTGVSVDEGSNFSMSQIRSNSTVIRKLESFTFFGGSRIQNYNFGFPGQAGNIHFNNKIIRLQIIMANTPDLKRK